LYVGVELMDEKECVAQGKRAARHPPEQPCPAEVDKADNAASTPTRAAGQPPNRAEIAPLIHRL
jgi:hypothetical protein